MLFQKRIDRLLLRDGVVREEIDEAANLILSHQTSCFACLVVSLTRTLAIRRERVVSVVAGSSPSVYSLLVDSLSPIPSNIRSAVRRHVAVARGDTAS